MFSFWGFVGAAVAYLLLVAAILALQSRIKELDEDLRQSEHMVRYWKRFYDDRKED